MRLSELIEGKTMEKAGTSGFKVMGFLAIALIFSADRTDSNIDLIDALIDYTVAETKALGVVTNEN